MISGAGMNFCSMTSTSSVTTVSRSVSHSSNTCQTIPGAGSGSGDGADISGPGKVFAGLKQLASQDPAKFKEVASDIADKLKDAAGTAGSSAAGAAQFLTDLASKFETAAQTGDVSGLQPPTGGRPAFGPVGGGYDQLGRSAASRSTLDLKALFESISKEVNDAVAGLGA